MVPISKFICRSQQAVEARNGPSPGGASLSLAEQVARDETRLAQAQTVLRVSHIMFGTAVAVMFLLIYTFIHADRDSASFYVSVVTCVLDAVFIAYNLLTALRYRRLRDRLAADLEEAMP